MQQMVIKTSGIGYTHVASSIVQLHTYPIQGVPSSAGVVSLGHTGLSPVEIEGSREIDCNTYLYVHP